MTKAALALICFAGLAACGADGEPTPPAPKDTTVPGVSVTGTARVGVSVSRDSGSLLAPGF